MSAAPQGHSTNTQLNIFEVLRIPASYKENALAEHYATSHPTCHEPSLKFALLRREKDLLRLRHTEAIMIEEMQPKLNRKSEGASLGLLIGNYTHSH